MVVKEISSVKVYTIFDILLLLESNYFYFFYFGNTCTSENAFAWLIKDLSTRPKPFQRVLRFFGPLSPFLDAQLSNERMGVIELRIDRLTDLPLRYPKFTLIDINRNNNSKYIILSAKSIQKILSR